MSADWPEVPLGDLGSFKNGANFNKTAYGDAHPVINVKNLFRGRFATIDDLDSLSADALKRVEDYFVQENDILFARSSVKASGAGQVALVREFHQGTIFSGFIIRFRPTDERLNPMYLYYLLRSPEYREILTRIATGTTISNLSQATLSKLPIRLPSRFEQDVIVDALDALDSKSEHNHQINQTLEQMAQAIFKSWFVDFEPVRAKIAARERWLALQPGNEPASPVCYAGELADQPNTADLDTCMNLAAMQVISGKNADQLARMQTEQPEQYAELRATAELFPSAMQPSELGEIPEGWSPVTVKHYIELAYGKALKKTDRIEGQFPVYGSGGITGNHNQALVAGPGIIVGRKGTVGSIYWESRDFYPIDTTYYVVAKDGCSLQFAYYLLQSLGLEKMNTDAAVPGLNRNNVYRLEVPYFPTDLIERFGQLTGSFTLQATALREQSASLTTIRDTLLPKLLSGELTLPDTEEAQTECQDVAHV